MLGCRSSRTDACSVTQPMIRPVLTKAKRLSDGRADALRHLEERAAELAAEVVPPLDSLLRLAGDRLEVEPRRGVDRQPPRDLDARHLGVELDSPRCVAEPERLRAHSAPSELDRPRRHAVRVEVPLERPEARRQT